LWQLKEKLEYNIYFAVSIFNYLSYLYFFMFCSFLHPEDREKIKDLKNNKLEIICTYIILYVVLIARFFIIFIIIFYNEIIED